MQQLWTIEGRRLNRHGIHLEKQVMGVGCPADEAALIYRALNFVAIFAA
jgi:hypothetical protein